MPVHLDAHAAHGLAFPDPAIRGVSDVTIHELSLPA